MDDLEGLDFNITFDSNNQAKQTSNVTADSNNMKDGWGSGTTESTSLTSDVSGLGSLSSE
jgi:hypothetical protein